MNVIFAFIFGVILAPIIFFLGAVLIKEISIWRLSRELKRRPK